jgi:class 3 adenylate cyclase
VRADQLLEEHFELLRDAIAISGGREVKNTGDGLMVAFLGESRRDPTAPRHARISSVAPVCARALALVQQRSGDTARVVLVLCPTSVRLRRCV